MSEHDEKFIVTDRYRALGVPYPDPETMCHGQCDGLGVYPESDDMDPPWIAAHLAAGVHNCDGTHFVKCPDCDGTGKRAAAAPLAAPGAEMSHFRKKPVVIEAVQLTWGTWSEMCDFLGREFFTNGGVGAQDGTAIGLDIPTLEGTLHASENDWIIRGVKGELYPCKPDIFAATYEPVDPPNAASVVPNAAAPTPEET